MSEKTDTYGVQTPQVMGNTAWDGLPMPQRVYAVLAIVTGLSLSVLDSSIANVSLPTMARELGVSASDSIWVVNAYQISTIMFLLPFATLGEIISYRRLYLIGIVLFTLSSLSCALSVSLTMLVLSRVVQGVGAALMMSVNTTLVRLIYPKRFLGRGLGVNAAVVAVASVAGPSIAGSILAVAQWPWLFAVNVPIGVLGFFLSRRYLPDNPVKVHNHHFDFVGSVLSVFTFGLMMVTVESLSHGWGCLPTSVLAFLFIFAAFLFVRNQWHKPFPILPFDLLRIPIFSLSVLTSICSFVAQMLAMIALPFYLQRTLGYTEVRVGLVMTSWPAVIMVVAPVAGYLVERIHAGVMGAVGLCVMSCGLFLLAFLPSGVSMSGICLRMVLCGLGFGIFQSPNNSTMIGSAPQQRSGSASGMLATARLTGQTVGASLVALLFFLSPVHGTQSALVLAGLVAILGATISGLRLTQKMPRRA